MPASLSSSLHLLMADLWNASWRAAAGGLPVVAATGEFRPSQSKLTKLLVPNLLGFQDFRHEPAEKSNETCASRLEYLSGFVSFLIIFCRDRDYCSSVQ